MTSLCLLYLPINKEEQRRVKMDAYEHELELLEVAYKKISGIKDTQSLEKAAKRHGIDLGKKKQDAHHADYPDAKDSETGKPARTEDNKVIGGSASPKGKIAKHTHGEKLKSAIVARQKEKINQRGGKHQNPGYWKSPDNKDQRKADAAANKAAKQKRRDPFKRMKEGLSFEDWMDNYLTRDN